MCPDEDIPADHKIEYVNLEKEIVYDFLASILIWILSLGYVICFDLNRFNHGSIIDCLLISCFYLLAGLIRGKSKLSRRWVDALIIYSVSPLLIVFGLSFILNSFTPLTLMWIVYPFTVIYIGLNLRSQWNKWNRNKRIFIFLLTILFMSLASIILLPLLLAAYPVTISD